MFNQINSIDPVEIFITAETGFMIIDPIFQIIHLN